MSIYVIQDNKDNPQEILEKIEAACSKRELERSELGQYVWSGGNILSYLARKHIYQFNAVNIYNSEATDL